MSLLETRTAAALAPGGALADILDGFAPRPAQQQLAAAIATAIEQVDVLLAEAGTGTGKTFAYLVPVLLSGKRSIISTGTRALQDQLFHRDLPRLQQALGVRVRAALLKGRANYLCRYRTEQALTAPQAASDLAELARVAAWAGSSVDGDVSGLAWLGEQSPLLPQVTSTQDNCLGHDCPFWGECFVVAARQRAQAADLVVVNHHLLLADLALKQEGFGEILPGAQTFIIDEAHQLPELAANFFGQSFGSRPLQELALDCEREAAQVAAAGSVIATPAATLAQALQQLRQAMGGLPVRGTQWAAMIQPAVADGFELLEQAIGLLLAALAGVKEASAGLLACHARAQLALRVLQQWLDAPAEPGLFDDAPAQETQAPSVRWYELTARGFRCQTTPMDVSAPLRAHRQASAAAWVFTSATLTVGGGFDHVAARLGLDDPATLGLPSPFDWTRQALCYLPPDLPDPGASQFGAAQLAAVLPVLQASGGRAFLLFASHRALREAAQALAGAPWPLFVQGTAPRALLLEQFRAAGNGVLLGTASFREGVDVVGDALSVVVIDKLPFAAPDDPVFAARLEAIERAGGNAFRAEQLPQAVIALKQGVGRLLRSETDRGVLVLCDRRLQTRSYGKVFFASLPPLRRTAQLAEVQAFFAQPPAADAPGAGTAHTDDLFDELN
ncbi:MAG: ATP-dependent DNA helicase [Stenotrophomonas sp.]